MRISVVFFSMSLLIRVPVSGTVAPSLVFAPSDFSLSSSFDSLSIVDQLWYV